MLVGVIASLATSLPRKTPLSPQIWLAVKAKRNRSVQIGLERPAYSGHHCIYAMLVVLRALSKQMKERFKRNQEEFDQMEQNTPGTDAGPTYAKGKDQESKCPPTQMIETTLGTAFPSIGH